MEFQKCDVNEKEKEKKERKNEHSVSYIKLQAEFFFFKDRMKLKKKGSDSLGNLHICSLHDENHGTGSDFSSVQSLSRVRLFATP